MIGPTRGGGYPPYFSYQEETKDLRENGAYEGEAKELGGENRTEDEGIEEMWSGNQTGEASAGEHERDGTDNSQHIIARRFYYINR
jgi:hypothetical protein